MAKKVVVVRVGAKTTHIVHMEYTANNPTIYGCMRIATPEGTYDDGTIIDAMELGQRIRKACKDKGIHASDVIFTVDSSKIANRETTIPYVAKSKIRQNVMARVPDLFPVDSNRYVFSYVLQGKEYENAGTEEGKPAGKVQDVHIFAAPAELVDSYYALADAAGLRLQAIEADGNSVFQMMRRQVKEGITMAVQINRSSTLVNIIDGEKMYLQRAIPYGINVFTEVMMQDDAFEAPDEEKAYDILTTKRVLLESMNMEYPVGDFSLAKRAEVTNNADYLISNIGRVIEYYNSRYKDQPITNVVCIGQGCNVAGLQELLTNELGMQVIVPTTLNGVRFNRKVAINAMILQYLNCFGSVFCPVRFVPQAIAMKEAKKGGLVGSVLIFFGLMLLSAALAAMSFFQVYMATEDRDALQARVQAMSPVQNEYDELMQLQADYLLTQVLGEYIDSNNNHFHELVKTISNMVPNSFRITSIQSDEAQVMISATSADKLSSLTALQIQLAKVEGIQDVRIEAVTENAEAATNRRQYTYTISFSYGGALVTEEGGQ